MNSKNTLYNKQYIEFSHKIGLRIASNALWTGDICNWHIRSNNLSRKTTLELATYEIYQGISGIALYLSELYKNTGDSYIKRCLLGALNGAFFQASKSNSREYGFFSGIIGLIYVSSTIGKQFKDQNILERAIKLIPNDLNKHSSLDIINGISGIIPALLIISKIQNQSKLYDLAIKLGENLINKATLEQVGFSWMDKYSHYSRPLLGFAHGSAGIGHALLELYYASGDGKFLYASERAFQYENLFYSSRYRNWPDFRKISDVNFQESVNSSINVIDYLKKNSDYMTTWCHGAPGILLSRIRAFEVTQNDEYKNEITKSIQTVVTSLKTLSNYSLCHGIYGNCDMLLYAAETLKDSKLRSIVENYATDAFTKIEEKKIEWPCGTTDRLVDPSLMLGESGIGYFYLRLANPKTPMITILRSGLYKKENPITFNSYFIAQKKHILFFFARILKVLNRMENIEVDKLNHNQLNNAYNTNTIMRVNQFIVKYIEKQSAEKRHILNDAFRPEKVKFQMSNSTILYYNKDSRQSTIPSQDFSSEKEVIQLKKDVKIVDCKYDWDSWLELPVVQEKLPLKKTYHLIYPFQNNLKIRSISSFSGFILSQLENGITLDKLRGIVYQQFNNSDNTKMLIDRKIDDQLENLRKSNFIKTINSCT